MSTALPPIPSKRYFTIGEVSELCAVKAHVLRYWEQEFTQLRPMKRGGNRRYYQHHEVLLIRRIRELLYDQGFTISGARNKLNLSGNPDGPVSTSTQNSANPMLNRPIAEPLVPLQIQTMDDVRAELLSICRLIDSEDTN